MTTQAANKTDSDLPASFVLPPTEFVGQRLKELIATDEQFRAVLPDAGVNDAKLKNNLGLAQIVATCMESYADRPALARRATELVTDPATGRATRRILKRYETVSYSESWARSRALAGVSGTTTTRPLRANDLMWHHCFCRYRFRHGRPGGNP